MPVAEIVDHDCCINQEPQDVIKAHSRTFRFASLFLPLSARRQAETLYAFCRYVDDLADNTDYPLRSRLKLQAILEGIQRRDYSDTLVHRILHLSNELGFDPDITAELIRGVLSDLNLVLIDSKEELLRYCYRVAGTVGLMMCPVLGVSRKEAFPFAIDLGIAMQLTNIARDVSEDAADNRRYIPSVWVKDLFPYEILQASPCNRALIQSSVEKILALANTYYASGLAGLRYIPLNSRFAIAVAARIYRDIGRYISIDDYATWNGRKFVSRSRKFYIAGTTFIGQIFRPDRNHGTHCRELHNCLVGMPGVYYK